MTLTRMSCELRGVHVYVSCSYARETEAWRSVLHIDVTHAPSHAEQGRGRDDPRGSTGKQRMWSGRSEGRRKARGAQEERGAGGRSVPCFWYGMRAIWSETGSRLLGDVGALRRDAVRCIDIDCVAI